MTTVYAQISFILKSINFCTDTDIEFEINWLLRVNWILEDITNYIDTHQFGSLKGLSTTYYLVKLLDDLCEGIDKPRHSSILVTTNFDRVSHQIVYEKFISLGVRSTIIPWICNFLTDRKQAVCYKGEISTWETTTAGVPQGTKLGPIVFLIMINDFVSENPDVSHYKYVDSITLHQTFHHTEKTSCMQQQLNCLQEWSAESKMKLNPKKSSPVFPIFILERLS